MHVRPMFGRYAGEVRDVIEYAARQMISSGRAVDIRMENLTKPALPENVPVKLALPENVTVTEASMRPKRRRKTKQKPAAMEA